MITDKDMRVFEGYSEWVERKIITPHDERLNENILGLVEEAGEVAGKVKRRLRDKTQVKREEILLELGDVLFYTTALANYYGYNLATTIAHNMLKLDGRESRKTIKGSGDKR